MKTQTHTPGSWKYHLGRGANPRFHIQTEGGYQIASTTELVRHPQAFVENEAREANARLIATAPELLGVAKTFSQFLGVIGHHEKMKSGVDAVIAKAEGRI